jgi:Carboxypeptidase regulatory-like domain
VVDDATGQPISGARVRSGSRSAQTAPDGTFTIGTDAGMVSLTVSAAEYFSNSVTAQATAGQTTNAGTVRLSSQNAPPPPPF